MKTNTDPRAAGSRDAQGLWKYIRSFTKSVDELAEHEMAKGESVPSVSRDGWHEPYRTDHIDAGKPTGATGADATEFAGRHRDESEQIGGSAAAETLSKLLERQERTEKALRRFFKAVDWDAHGMDDEEEDSEKSDSEDEDEVDKSMPSISVSQLMGKVSGNGTGIKAPPQFMKASGPGLWQQIESQIEQLPLGKSFVASELLGMAQMVRSGHLDEDSFQTKLHGADQEIKRIFDPLGRDHVVSRWAS